MPPSRLLLRLCRLLLALAVTVVSAGAPLYGPGDVSLAVASFLSSTTRDTQMIRCTSQGGALVPMATEAIYNLVQMRIESTECMDVMIFMGGSSLLSPPTCTKNASSLDCIWYWDEGRYKGADNAVAFYKGNRGPSILPGAAMIGTTVENHWRAVSANESCPCAQMERYSAVLNDGDGLPYWSDSDSSSYSYSSEQKRTYFAFCAVEMRTLTTTPAPTTTQTTTVRPPTTTGAEPSEDLPGLNLPLVIGLSVGGAVVVILAALLIVSYCCRWLCFAQHGGLSGAEKDESHCTLARRGSMPGAGSHRSSRSDFDDAGNRSFHNDASGKNGSCCRSSLRGDAEVEELEGGNALASRSASQLMQSSSFVRMAVAPPPGAVTAPMMVPPQTVPDPPPVMHDA